MTSEQLRRAAFLQEMGVGTIWLRRNAVPVPIPFTDSDHLVSEADNPAEVVKAVDIAALASTVAPGADLPISLPASAAPFSPVADNTNISAAWDDVPVAVDPATLPSAAEIALMDWPQLQSAVTACRGCDLCRTRSQTVFGSGDRQAKWLFVGEGPSRTEDQQGAPFVGPAGKLLDGMLAAIGLKRDVNVYLSNVVKCRSADAHDANHTPSPQQIALCKPYLERQIALLQPTVIVALGKTAALALLECSPDTSLSSLRGQLHRVNQLSIVVTYHPAYLLRNPIAKRETWDDLCLALSTYADQAAE